MKKNIKNIKTDDLFLLAELGNTQILKHPLVGSVFNQKGWTPLHILACRARIQVLKHPLAAKVKIGGKLFSFHIGMTPLHVISIYCCKSKNKILKILAHPDIDKVKDGKERTPLYILAARERVPKEWLIEKYPWFNLDSRFISKNVISEILNYQNAEKFIGSL